MRRKLIVVALAAALSGFGLVGTATPAQASCTTVPGVEDLGCVETVPCRLVVKLGNCVQ